MTTRKTAELSLHPVNKRVYGSSKYEYLSESIAEKGVYEAILITNNNLIINGGRRWKVAKILGLEEVPVVVFPSDDELDIKEAVVHCNKQREKEPFMKCEEATVLIEVEEERARIRRAEAAVRASQQAAAMRRGDATLRQTFAEGSEEDAGRARDKVGEALGVSGFTASKMVKVGKAVKKAEEDGDTDAVEKIKDAVNTKGVEAGLREIKKPKPAAEVGATPTEPSAEEKEQRADRALNALRKHIRALGEEGSKAWCARHGLSHEALMGREA